MLLQEGLKAVRNHVLQRRQRGELHRSYRSCSERDMSRARTRPHKPAGSAHLERGQTRSKGDSDTGETEEERERGRWGGQAKTEGLAPGWRMGRDGPA